MTKYSTAIVVGVLLFCFSETAYCWSINDLKNTAQNAASAVLNNASTGNSGNNNESQGSSGVTEREIKSGADAKPITAQYGDFKWGMSMSDAKEVLLKNAKVGQFGDSVIVFSDRLFDGNVHVKLIFTPKSKKLYSVYIGELPTNGFLDEQFKTVLNSLDQKYGQHWLLGGQRNQFAWGNVEKGDMLGISGEGFSDSYTITYLNTEMAALERQETGAQQEEQKQKLSNEAASKL